MKLKAPDEFWELNDEERKKMLNQCGPNGPLNHIIPNQVFGLDWGMSCDIHDYMFTKARTAQDLKDADQVFLRNMLKQVDAKPDILSFPRKVIAHIYYGAVRIYSWFQK